MATLQVQCNYNVVDELGTEASVLTYFDAADTISLAQAVADFQTLGTAIAAVTGAVVKKGRVAVMLPFTDSKGTPAAGSRIEQSAVFNFSNGSTTRRQGIVIPAVSDSLISGGKIGLSGAVSTLIALLSTGTTLATLVPTNAAFQVLTTLYDAFLSFRKRRRQLDRSSYEL